MSFSNERTVKATRNEHQCDGCRQLIAKGSPAYRWAGVTDGDFGSCTYHLDCREAEVAYNREILNVSWDEWSSLDDAVDDGGEDWLREKFPAVAERLCGLVKVADTADA